MSMPLIDIASVIRSKNAGPGELTFDVIFKSAQWYQRVLASGEFTSDLFAALYGVSPEDVVSVIAFEPAHAIKATIRRRVPSGAVTDTDIYGAQQHVPLMQLVLHSVENEE